MARKFPIIEGKMRTKREGLLLYDEAVSAAGDKRLATRAEVVAYLSSKKQEGDRQGKTLDTHKGEKPDWGVTSGTLLR